MRRIAVIGCPGAGKTELSRRLNAITGLPLIHLDRLYHDGRFDYRRNRSAWRQRVQELVHEPAWLIDGNYRSTFDIRLPAADTIIFLDYPTWLCLSRAIRRRLHFRTRVRPDMPASWREQLGFSFLHFILQFRRRQAPELRRRLAELASDRQVIILKSPRQAEHLLTELGG